MEITCKLVVPWQYGVHMRPATKIVKLLRNFDSETYFSIHSEKYNAKKILELISMEAYCGQKIKFSASGSDAQEVVEKLKELFSEEDDDDDEESQIGAY
ncbi:HPr family phosphocarrier protein [Candidatus Uabimicrobium amorphum]|uniref:Phosphocarrier protein HPr n=1 Tax=Uabimicrobium amorphum TaxID=2596890 RepID=A0A5S9IKF4_UABAM|nr:HPr family phosphocarrier protein [Candidatus Uabimicrobium amorphum]BBM83177.1 phosphocarrier protein HPr [Candidatus Uabimicrobium amorphum]